MQRSSSGKRADWSRATHNLIDMYKHNNNTLTHSQVDGTNDIIYIRSSNWSWATAELRHLLDSCWILRISLLLYRQASAKNNCPTDIIYMGLCYIYIILVYVGKQLAAVARSRAHFCQVCLNLISTLSLLRVNKNECFVPGNITAITSITKCTRTVY